MDVSSATLDGAKCLNYTGSVCSLLTSQGVNRKFLLYPGNTQLKIDEEIKSALVEQTFKYIDCQSYVKYLMCEEKIRPCDNKGICADSCVAAKESVCFKNLDKSSKLFKWFNNFNCDTLANDLNDCKSLRERRK